MQPYLSDEVPGKLHDGLHLSVVLEEALSEQGLVVGLALLGLDGRLHAGLGRLRRRRLAVRRRKISP